MKQSVLSRYAPFLALAALQLFLVTMSDPVATTTALDTGTGTDGATNGALRRGAPRDGGRGRCHGDDGAAGGSGVVGTGGGTDNTVPGATRHRQSGDGGRRTTAASARPADCSRRTSPGSRRRACRKFVGDNGGATFRGVTKDKITVVVFYPKYERRNPAGAGGQQPRHDAGEGRRGPRDPREVLQQALRVLRPQHRRAVLLSTEQPDAATMRADAKAIVQKFNPFAVLYYAQGLGPAAFHEQLAREGVLNLGVAPVGRRVLHQQLAATCGAR